MARDNMYYRNIAIIISVVLLSTLLIYLPFIFKLWIGGLQLANSDLSYIYRNYDGPLYIIPAKTFYNTAAIRNLGIELPLDPKYFAAHLPVYPVFIRLFSFMGYLHSMVFVNILSTAALALLFYHILRRYKLSANPVLLTTIFLFLPRFLVVRSVGAPESLFMLLILASLYCFEQKKYFLAGIAGALATATKTPGILLIAAYGLVIVERFVKTRRFDPRTLFLLLIPAGLAGVFYLYYVQMGDFFAYFHTGGVVPIVYPYAAFNFQKTWIGTAWLEDIIMYFFLYLYAAVSMKEVKQRSFFYFAVVFFAATTFVQHRDIARYSLPLWPIACIALNQWFTSRKFLVVFLILLPAIYLYAWNFIVYNIIPISNWAPFV